MPPCRCRPLLYHKDYLREQLAMKIRYHKPISVYTHPSITEYEFNRMQNIERLYLNSCAVGLMLLVFSFPCILISSAKEEKPQPPVVVEPTVQEPSSFPEVLGEATLETTYAINVDVGSTTIDTR
jgi:hypothetical protein